VVKNTHPEQAAEPSQGAKGIIATRNRATNRFRPGPMKLPDPLLALRAMQHPKYDQMRVFLPNDASQLAPSPAWKWA
jgi:hypothetical protein